jgi:hypothetical protein
MVTWHTFAGTTKVSGFPLNSNVFVEGAACAGAGAAASIQLPPNANAATAPEPPNRATTRRFITGIHPFPPRRPADVAF